MTNNNEEVEMDKIERIVEGLKKMRTLDSQEVEAVLSNGTLLSDWLRTNLLAYGAECEAKGREEEREKIAVEVWRLWGQTPDNMEDTEQSRIFSKIIKFIRSTT